MFRATVLATLFLAACAGEDALPASQPTVVPPCHVGGGCASRVCSEERDVVATCEWRAEYACYGSARCEPQEDGRCGWTPTPELLACLASPPRG